MGKQTVITEQFADAVYCAVQDGNKSDLEAAIGTFAQVPSREGKGGGPMF